MIDWLAYWLVRILGAVLCRLPPIAAVWTGERLGLLAYWLQPKRRQVGVINLRAAFQGRYEPAQARSVLRACFQHLGAGVIELLRLPVIDRDYVERYIAIEGRAHFEQAVGSGRPVIILTGHFGNWELSSIVAALQGYPVVALARAQRNMPRLYRLLVSYRESKGCTIIHKGGAVKRLIAAMNQRRLIGIVGDQASRHGVLIPLFGRAALFAPGPFELAYSRQALIVPVFIHRVRGPFHRIVLEPAMALDQRLPKDRAVEEGLERFAETLSRHVAQDPAQWLWMHKRWKHTPSRRALVLSDGKAGHLKQSMAVIDALRQQAPQLEVERVEIRYKHRPARLLALCWSWWIPRRWGDWCLAKALAPASRRALLTRHADVIVSCGSSTVPANVLWSAQNRAKSIVIMNPAPVPLSRFDLVIAPRHDALPRRGNVVEITGALSQMPSGRLTAASRQLLGHPRFRSDGAVARPVIAVCIGGDTRHYAVDPGFAETIMTQVFSACESSGGCCVVTTSRRTTARTEHALMRIADHPRCRLLLIASRDPLEGTMDGMLGLADVAVVTGESISMVSEARASGRPVIVVPPPRQRPGRRPTKQQRFLQGVAQSGHLRISEASGLSDAIRAQLRQPANGEPVNDFETVRVAVAKTLGVGPRTGA